MLSFSFLDRWALLSPYQLIELKKNARNCPGLGLETKRPGLTLKKRTASLSIDLPRRPATIPIDCFNVSGNRRPLTRRVSDRRRHNNRDYDCGRFACGKKRFVRFRTSWPLDATAGKTFFLSPAFAPLKKKKDLFYSAPSRACVCGRIKNTKKKNVCATDRRRRRRRQTGTVRVWRPGMLATGARVHTNYTWRRAARRRNARRIIRRQTAAVSSDRACQTKAMAAAPTHERRSFGKPPNPVRLSCTDQCVSPMPRNGAKKKEKRSSTYAIHRQTCTTTRCQAEYSPSVNTAVLTGLRVRNKTRNRAKSRVGSRVLAETSVKIKNAPSTLCM